MTVSNEGDLIAAYNFLMRGSGDRGANLSSLVIRDWMQGNGLKVHLGTSDCILQKSLH